LLPAGLNVDSEYTITVRRSKSWTDGNQ
jgi:hypothetical protein